MSGFKQQFQTAVRTPSGNALEEFMLLNGRYLNFTKETFFIRYISEQDYDRDIARLCAWAGKSGPRECGCVFARTISAQPPAEEVHKYAAMYQNGSVKFPFHFENVLWQEALECGFSKILELFKQARGRSEDSIVRNFAVKMLYWIDIYFPPLFTDSKRMNRFPKFSCGGNIKLAEYLFLYLLFLLGCDVLYISPKEDISIIDQKLLKLSLQIREDTSIRTSRAGRTQTEGLPSQGNAVIPMNRIRRPERHVGSPVKAEPSRVSVPAIQENGRKPLEFEELAKFASSVVMLKVFDQNNQCFKSGSGVIINDKGYILTNLHVVNGGHYYGILLEEETDVFYTNELIKYHQDYDLAILRMEKHRKPIPISRGVKKLVRGQKVVAIGSPLGLFNSVSNGIISGFRDMETVSMIQFTAPVSHGSSGGALLDMYGDLIGIITAGFDDGQNLNLAVDYQTIFQFARSFLS